MLEVDWRRAAGAGLMRFIERHDKYPTSNHAAAYSGVLHFLKAREAAKTGDGKKIVAQMKAMPTDDEVYGKGSVRVDGRKLHPMYLFQVKTPAESKGPWDFAKVIAEVPADEAWRSLAEGGCALAAAE